MKRFLLALLLGCAASAEGLSYRFEAHISGLQGEAGEARPKVVTMAERPAIIQVGTQPASGQAWKDGYRLSLKPGELRGEWLELDCQLEVRDTTGTSTANFQTRVPLGQAYVFAFGPEDGPRYELQLVTEIAR